MSIVLLLYVVLYSISSIGVGKCNDNLCATIDVLCLHCSQVGESVCCAGVNSSESEIHSGRPVLNISLPPDGVLLSSPHAKLIAVTFVHQFMVSFRYNHINIITILTD